eukprot:CAMPEP_0182446272 /NCGR_PEP_ID=MMETSP1172-20130603/4098_1 /TAXON_ID=708627 /ORGANISM="Timspurckia oligopyrenoides, Strain CCMP3278" /LENGTH=505 /DNA_ID=CAMNT_0024642181 /DNA_START=177 /DNA_END=1694 /DNA_ORIENTATION=+
MLVGDRRNLSGSYDADDMVDSVKNVERDALSEVESEPSESELLFGVSESWAMLVRNRVKVAQAFYGLLFERYPEFRSMFPPALNTQFKHFTMTLEYLVKNLWNMEEVESTVRSLGRRHATYGVNPESFDAIGVCLLDTLKGALGDDAPKYAYQGWASVYAKVAGIAKEGCEEELALAAEEEPEFPERSDTLNTLSALATESAAVSEVQAERSLQNLNLEESRESALVDANERVIVGQLRLAVLLENSKKRHSNINPALLGSLYYKALFSSCEPAKEKFTLPMNAQEERMGQCLYQILCADSVVTWRNVCSEVADLFKVSFSEVSYFAKCVFDALESPELKDSLCVSEDDGEWKQFVHISVRRVLAVHELHRRLDIEMESEIPDENSFSLVSNISLGSSLVSRAAQSALSTPRKRLQNEMLRAHAGACSPSKANSEGKGSNEELIYYDPLSYSPVVSSAPPPMTVRNASIPRRFMPTTPQKSAALRRTRYSIMSLQAIDEVEDETE